MEKLSNKQRILNHLKENAGELFSPSQLCESCDIAREDVASKMARELVGSYPDFILKGKNDSGKVAFGYTNDPTKILEIKSTITNKTKKVKSTGEKKARIPKEPKEKKVRVKKEIVIETDILNFGLNAGEKLVKTKKRIGGAHLYGIIKEDGIYKVKPEKSLISLITNLEKVSKLSFLLD